MVGAWMSTAGSNTDLQTEALGGWKASPGITYWTHSIRSLAMSWCGGTNLHLGTYKTVVEGWPCVRLIRSEIKSL